MHAERPDNKSIDLSIFHKVIIGKPPCVHKNDVVQFQGQFIKAYLHVTLPDVNPPPQYMQDEWLDADCAVVLANILAKESLKTLLGIFQDDAIALRDWAKEKVAAAIWQNKELQDELPRIIATSLPRFQQIWHQECEKYFPPEAQEKVAKALVSVKAEEQKESLQDQALKQKREIARELDASPTTAPLPSSPPPNTAPGPKGHQVGDVKEEKTPIRKLTLPVQFDYIHNCFIDADGKPSPQLPLRLVDVVRAWFEPHPLNKKSIQSKLSYVVIANLYVRGTIKDDAPNLNEKEILDRLEYRQVKEKPAYFAQRFATDLRRILGGDGYGIPSKVLFRCDERSQSYYLVPSALHKTKPVVNIGEMGLARQTKRRVDSGGSGESKDDGGQR